MRKYYRLILTLTAIISVCCFAFYKKQYDELSDIFQSMGFYATPNPGLKTEQEHHSPEAFSLWKRVGNLHVKNGYIVEDQILLIGLTSGLMSTVTCDVNGRNSTTVNVEIGYDFLSLKSNLDDFRVVIVKCGPLKTPQDPISVRLTDRDSHDSVVIPMASAEFTYVHNRIAICLKNEISVHVTADRNSAIEFLAYHAAVGVKDLYWYTSGITQEMMHTVSGLQRILDLSVHFVPWNIPTDDDTLNHLVVQLDCMMQSVASAQWSVLLHLDEVLHYSIESTLNNILKAKSGSFGVPVLKSLCNKNFTHLETTKIIYYLDGGRDLRNLIEAKPTASVQPSDLSVVHIESCNEGVFQHSFWNTDANLNSIAGYFMSEYYQVVRKWQ